MDSGYIVSQLYLKIKGDENFFVRQNRTDNEAFDALGDKEEFIKIKEQLSEYSGEWKLNNHSL